MIAQEAHVRAADPLDDGVHARVLAAARIRADKPGTVGLPCNGLNLRLRSTSAVRAAAGEMGDIHLLSGRTFLGYGRIDVRAARAIPRRATPRGR